MTGVICHRAEDWTPPADGRFFLLTNSSGGPETVIVKRDQEPFASWEWSRQFSDHRLGGSIVTYYEAGSRLSFCLLAVARGRGREISLSEAELLIGSNPYRELEIGAWDLEVGS